MAEYEIEEAWEYEIDDDGNETGRRRRRKAPSTGLKREAEHAVGALKALLLWGLAILLLAVAGLLVQMFKPYFM